MRVAAMLAALALAAPAAAQSVVDGDTIRIGAATFRLWGIDAPESRQPCADGWQAGQAASRAQTALMEGRSIACEPRGQDRYGRTIAVCRADRRDLGAAMVRAGMALAFTRYSTDYVADEAKAKAARFGLHVHGCAAPWDWRAGQRKAN
jgi:endonuclease YncB( thermonuclease family)